MIFFFNDTASAEISTLSLHDALPISGHVASWLSWPPRPSGTRPGIRDPSAPGGSRIPGRLPERSEEHTSELQSRLQFVCRLLLRKKNSPDGGHPTHSEPARPPCAAKT